MEQKPERNDNDEKNDKKILQEIPDKFAELSIGIPEPLDVAVEGMTVPSDLGVANADTYVVEVVTDDVTVEGKSAKPYKSNSAVVKTSKEQNRGRDDTTKDQDVSLFLTGAKTGRTGLEQPSDKGKRNSKKSKKQKAAAYEQKKSSLSFEFANVETNENERPEVKDNKIMTPRDLISNTDNISAFMPLEHTFAKSTKISKKSKKPKCRVSKEEKDEDLSKNINVVHNIPDMPVIKTEEDLSLHDTENDPQDKISEPFKESIPLISGGIGEQDADQCMKWVAETENIQAQTPVAILPEEAEAQSEVAALLEENLDEKYSYTHEMPLSEREVFESYNESLHEHDKEIFISTPGQRDEKLESIGDETVYKSDPKHKDTTDDSGDENLNNQEHDIYLVSTQENMVHRGNEIQEEKTGQLSREENVSLDAVSKSKKCDKKMKARRTTNVQPVNLQVNIPHKSGHETEDICSTVLSHSSSEIKKHILGTSLVQHGTSQVTENLDAIVLTPQWMAKSPVNLSSEDPFNLKQSDIFDLTDHSVSDISHVHQAANQNHGNDSPLTQSSVSLPHRQVVLPMSSSSVSSNFGLTQEILNAQEETINIELHGVDNAGIFGSVKERQRKPRKIIDTLTVDEKVVKSIDISTPLTQEKKRKPPKSPVNEDTRKRDGKVKMAEEPKDLEEHEEYRAMKDKMKKKKRRPKIPIEFTSPQTKVENDLEAVKVNLDVKTAKKHEPDEIVESESEVVPVVTDVDSFHLQNIVKSDLKIGSDLASAYSQPVSPETVVIKEQAEHETSCAIDDSNLSNSKMKPLLLEATSVRVPKEEPGTQLRLSDYCSTEIKLDIQESESNVPQEAAKPHTSCMMKSDELSDAWMSALDEPLVFDVDEDDEDYGNVIVTSPSSRSIETDDALVKIQEAVIAAVESIYDRSECDLKAGTVRIAPNDMPSEAGLKSETIPTLENGVYSDSVRKTEGITAVGKDILSEPDVKTEMTHAIVNDVLSEPETTQTVAKDMNPESGQKTDVIPMVLNDVLSKPGMKAATVTEVANDMSKTCLKSAIVPTLPSDVLSESGQKIERASTVSDDILPEPSLKTETVAEVINDVLSEPYLMTETHTTVVDKVVYEPDIMTEAVTEVVSGVISDPDMKTETANDPLSQPFLMTETVTAIVKDVTSEPGLNSETVSSVTIDMMHELGLKMETVKDMVSESDQVTETVTTIFNDVISLPGLMPETVVNDAVSESALMTQGNIKVSNDEISEDGLMTETVTMVGDGVVSEPGLLTGTIVAISDDVVSE
ncbi:hypothetical protein B7P43_G00883, partial [Cryptotermes secundus]